MPRCVLYIDAKPSIGLQMRFHVPQRRARCASTHTPFLRYDCPPSRGGSMPPLLGMWASPHHTTTRRKGQGRVERIRQGKRDPLVRKRSTRGYISHKERGIERARGDQGEAGLEPSGVDHGSTERCRRKKKHPRNRCRSRWFNNRVWIHQIHLELAPSRPNISTVGRCDRTHPFRFQSP